MKNRDCKKWFETAEIRSIAKINVKLQISVCIWTFTCQSAFFLHSELYFWLGRVRLGWVGLGWVQIPIQFSLAFIRGSWLFSINRGISCKTPKHNHDLAYYIYFRDFVLSFYNF